MTDDEFLSLVPGTTIYHRELDGYEATVETAPGHRPRKLWSILGKPKLSDMCVQIMTCKGRRQLIYGGAPTREWCLNLEETEDGLRRAQAARSSAQRRKKEEEEWIKRQPIQQAKRLAERKRAAGPHHNTDNWVCLRFEGKYDKLSEEEAKACIIRLGLFDSKWNPTGRFEKEFVTSHSQVTVVERRTGLMWQRNVDLPSGDLGDALTHIEKLNRQRFAGFDDWRIPTLEEAATLLEPRRSDAAHLYLDPVFGSRHSDPEGAFLRATQSHDAVLGFISACNERERKPEPPWCIITADHYPVSEPYRVEGWHINFLEGQVSWLIEVPELLACRSVGGDEVYGA